VGSTSSVRAPQVLFLTSVLEAGRPIPPFPSLFIKPATALADYGEAVPIPRCAQEGEADYEGELCVVIGRDAKDVSKEDALSYVGGYTAGDDVSTRKWQRFKERAGGVPQWCFSKVSTTAPELR
jgi:2-keto-4-pentenoate hydratase/2-oxohepta-3-ene-1,7-dioic acid hydratase in catechol pathway